MANVGKIISTDIANIVEISEIDKDNIKEISSNNIYIPPTLYDYHFDPSRSSIYLTFENENKKVTNTRQYNYQIGRTLESISSSTGKHYWEIDVRNNTVADYIFFGISFNDVAVVTDNPADWANVGWYSYYHNVTIIDAVQVAYNSDSGHAWWGIDGVFGGDPVNDTGWQASISGIVRPFIAFWATGLFCEFNTGTPLFTPPEGYFPVN